MLTTAADLIRARESAGVSLEEVAERTKICLRHLRALEDGCLKHWPPGFYARAYARAYAAEIGLDPATVIAFVGERMPLAEPPAAMDQPAMASVTPGPALRLWQTVVMWRRPQQA